MKLLFKSIDAAIARGDRDTLCQLLACLLAREAIVRALLGERQSQREPSSSAEVPDGGEP